MSWPFLHLFRRTWRSSDNWGTLYMSDADGKWKRLCYTFERPWFIDKQGRSHVTIVRNGKTILPGSRISEGLFELEECSGGEKGWRLRLLGTRHRTNIEIHRAHKSLYIEGCILPVSFMDFRQESANGTLVKVTKGDQRITTASVQIMGQIKDRYVLLSKLHAKEGHATLLIAAYLPPYEPRALSVATV